MSTFQTLEFVREGGYGRIYVGDVRHQRAAIKIIPKVVVDTIRFEIHFHAMRYK